MEAFFRQKFARDYPPIESKGRSPCDGEVTQRVCLATMAGLIKENDATGRENQGFISEISII